MYGYQRSTYDFILDRLAIGAFSARSMPDWKAIITAVSEEELAIYTDDFTTRLTPDVPVLFIPIWDGKPGLAPHLDNALAFIHENIARGPVLVHCAAGKSRSVSIVTAYLIRCGFDLAHASAWISQRRPEAAPAQVFIDEIKEHFKGALER